MLLLNIYNVHLVLKLDTIVDINSKVQCNCVMRQTGKMATSDVIRASECVLRFCDVPVGLTPQLHLTCVIRYYVQRKCLNRKAFKLRKYDLASLCGFPTYIHRINLQSSQVSTGNICLITIIGEHFILVAKGLKHFVLYLFMTLILLDIF